MIEPPRGRRIPERERAVAPEEEVLEERAAVAPVCRRRGGEVVLGMAGEGEGEEGEEEEGDEVVGEPVDAGRGGGGVEDGGVGRWGGVAVDGGAAWCGGGGGYTVGVWVGEVVRVAICVFQSVDARRQSREIRLGHGRLLSLEKHHGGVGPWVAFDGQECHLRALLRHGFFNEEVEGQVPRHVVVAPPHKLLREA